MICRMEQRLLLDAFAARFVVVTCILYQHIDDGGFAAFHPDTFVCAVILLAVSSGADVHFIAIMYFLGFYFAFAA